MFKIQFQIQTPFQNIVQPFGLKLEGKGATKTSAFNCLRP